MKAKVFTLPGVCRRCLPSRTTIPVVRLRVGSKRTQHHTSHGMTSRPQHYVTSLEGSFDEDALQMQRSSRDPFEVDIRTRNSDPHGRTVVQRCVSARTVPEDLSDVMTSGHVSSTTSSPSLLVRRGRNVHDSRTSTRSVG